MLWWIQLLSTGMAGTLFVPINWVVKAVPSQLTAISMSSADGLWSSDPRPWAGNKPSSVPSGLQTIYIYGPLVDGVAQWRQSYLSSFLQIHVTWMNFLPCRWGGRCLPSDKPPGQLWNERQQVTLMAGASMTASCQSIFGVLYYVEYISQPYRPQNATAVFPKSLTFSILLPAI